MNYAIFLFMLVTQLSLSVSLHRAVHFPRLLLSSRLRLFSHIDKISKDKVIMENGVDSSSFSVRPEEDELFESLRRVVNEEKLGTTIRVAGGWVRDRLLGFKGKNDIDLALDNMVGTKFAEKIVAWNDKTHVFPPLNYHVVQLNPDKSKHLETVTMKIGKFDIDFVNLRSESYSNESRVPLMKFGTPEEDATRRDLTINSLFYNINTKSIEDMTGKGIQDLNRGIIRTPLPPMQTLIDDPLRVFRAIRFASRFHFKIDAELQEAMMNPDVHTMLQQKVSRERISQELSQMLAHPESSTEAVILLDNLKLLPLVFDLPRLDDNTLIVPENRQRSITSKHSADKTFDIFIPSLYHSDGLSLYMTIKAFLHNYPKILLNFSQSENDNAGNNIDQNAHNFYAQSVYGDDSSSVESNFVLRYAAMLDHGREIVYRQLTSKKKPTFKNISLTHHICVHQLFIGKKNSDSVVLLQDASQILYSYIDRIDSPSSLALSSIHKNGHTVPCFGPFDRVTLGIQLREWGDHFRSIFLLCCGKVVQKMFIEMIRNSTMTSELCSGNPSNADHEIAYHIAGAYLKSMFSSRTDELECSEKPRSIFEDAAIKNHDTLADLLNQCMQNGVKKSNIILDAVVSLGLENEHKRPLLLSGKEIKQILTQIPFGPKFREIVLKQVQYELCFPNSSKSDVAEYLKDQYREYV